MTVVLSDIYQRRYPISEPHVLVMAASSIHTGAQPCFFPVSKRHASTARETRCKVLSRLYILVAPRTMVFISHSSQTTTCTESARSSNMSSANLNKTTAQSIVDRYPDTSTTTSDAKGDHPLSPPESAPKLGETPNSTITKPQWNGDPMDWGSWPTGRPGPFVSKSRMQEVMDIFKHHNGTRNEQSRTKECVMHMAEFSSSGRGEFDIYHN